jgi:hypothetical protein
MINGQRLGKSGPHINTSISSKEIKKGNTSYATIVSVSLPKSGLAAPSISMEKSQ